MLMLMSFEKQGALNFFVSRNFWNGFVGIGIDQRLYRIQMLVIGRYDLQLFY